jgi:glycosyltransferase involved in cell wall biosynthesis
MSPEGPKLILSNWQASNVATHRKPVLFVGAFPRPAALERYVSGDLALRLHSRGWHTYITSRRTSRVLRALEIPFQTWCLRKKYSVACVDVYSGPAFLWAEAACSVLRALGKPYVLTLHGGNLPEFSREHPGRVQKLLSLAAAVTCPSAYLLAEMRPMRPDLILFPNGLDLTRYYFREPQLHPRHLVWLRAFHEIYNPVLAVEVLSRIRKDYPTVLLTMIGPCKGDGSLQKTKDATRRLGVETAVSFPGAIPKQDVARHLAQADIFLNTTNFDNTPVSVLEAMACGLPVISTEVGGISYLLKDNETALLVPPANAEAMTQALSRLLRETGLAARLARAARQQIAAFDWARVLPQWEGLLERLIND